MIFDLCRWWKKDHAWWDALPGDMQALYLADYRLECQSRAREQRMAAAKGRHGR